MGQWWAIMGLERVNRQINVPRPEFMVGFTTSLHFLATAWTKLDGVACDERDVGSRGCCSED